MIKGTRILLLIGALILLAVISSRAQEDPGLPDTLIVDSVSAFANSAAILPVSLINDQPLSGMDLTLKVSSDDVVFDSVSFAGTRLENVQGFAGGLSLDDTTFTMFFQATNELIPVGGGVSAYFYFSFQPGTLPQLVTVDTITFTEPPFIEYSTTLQDSTTTDQPYIPQFVAGMIHILEPPPTMDSLWVDDYEVNPGDTFDVDVNLYNESSVKDLQIALDYGASLLTIDTVIFSGTRSSVALQKQVTKSSSLHRVLIELGFGDATALGAGSGSMAVIRFIVQDTAVDTSFTIDTTTYSTQATLLTRPSSEGGTQLVPIWHDGLIDMRIPTDVEDLTDPENLPSSFALWQNYPNPFNPSTQIDFELPTATHVSLKVYNILGREVRTLLDRSMTAGVHRVIFDAKSDEGTALSTGVYFYRLATDDFTDSKKMILLK